MQSKLQVNLEGLKELIEQYPQASQTARISRLTESLLLLDREIKPLIPVGAGPIHLRDTLVYQVSTTGQSVRGILGTPAAYGAAIESGTKPHFPPFGPILFWVERRLGLEGKEAIRASHAIVRKIGKKGTYGTYMFKYGFERNEASVVDILNKIPDDIAKSLNHN